jgi:hypothetical protein
MAQGLPPEDARARAQAKFGSTTVAADECRDERGTAFIDNTIGDLQYALRTFKRRSVSVRGHMICARCATDPSWGRPMSSEPADRGAINPAIVVGHQPRSLMASIEWSFTTRGVDGGPTKPKRKLLILLGLQGWLTSLDNFRNWLIRSACSLGQLSVTPRASAYQRTAEYFARVSSHDRRSSRMNAKNRASLRTGSSSGSRSNQG